MTDKQCTICGEIKSLEDFVKDSRLSSGRASKCKACNRAYAAKLRKENPEAVAAYKRRYIDNNKEKIIQSIEDYYAKNPHKRKAHSAVKRAIASGQLTKEPCSICGSTENIQAHHEDYDKPLEVIWLCRTHHSELHRK